MQIYRTPFYLDTEILIPIANRWGIEVDTDIEVTAKDRTSKKGGVKGSAAVPGLGSAGIDFGSGTEGEIEHSRVVKAHPGAALNMLLDQLHGDDSLITDIENEAITKSALVEIEADWEVSPVTDTGALIRSMFQFMANNPQAINNQEVPPAFAASIISSETTTNRKIVLNRISESDNQTRVIALLDSGLLVNNSSEDDLEDDKTILGLVETFKSEGKSYSLESFLSGGVGRALRRKVNATKMYESFGTLFGENFSEEDLQVQGPVIVLRVVAVYP